MEVTAVWQWWNYLASHCSPEKQLLRLNLDETAVRPYMDPVRGLVVTGTEEARDKPLRSASRRQQRTCLSHIAIVCDDTSVQPVLPQIIVGNCKAVLKKVQATLAPQLRENVFLLRRKSAWVNADLMVNVLKVLGTVLQPYTDERQPILLMDACPAHLAAKVFRAAARANVWVIIVPAKLTGLLQPADTHVFYRYKMYLRKQLEHFVITSASGSVSIEDLILAINQGVQCVLQKYAWSAAFDANGFSVGQHHTRAKIWRAMGVLPANCKIYSEMLSLEQWQSIWPAGALIPCSDIFAWRLPRVPRRGITRSTHTDAAALPAVSWLSRLRPRRALHESDFFESFLDDVAAAPATASTAPWPVPPPAPHRPVIRRATPIAMSRH